ncbi:MAG: T9SS type A sorting domain-containing protein [Bacteroidia bacterium]
MKKKYIVLAILLCSNFLINAQTSVYQKTYGGPDDDIGFSVIATADGGYAMTGSTKSFGAGDFDVLLVKLDADANLQWSRVFGGTGTEEAISLIQCNDGGYAICGKTSSYGQGSNDAMLIKTDSNGNLLQMKVYGGSNDERLLHIHQTNDNGLILSGSTASYGQGNWDMMYIKTDSVGDTLWTKILGGTGYDQGTDAVQTNDGGYIISGREQSWSAGYVDIFLAKLNANGDTLWTRAYGGAGWDEGMKVKQTYDGGYIVTGGSTGFIDASYDAYLNKVDSDGHLTWSKLYSGLANDATYDVLQLEDSGYIIMGITDSYGANHQKQAHPATLHPSELFVSPPNHVLGSDNSNILVIRTDPTGDTLWSRAYGGVLQDEGYAIIQTLDKGFMIDAYGKSFGTDSLDFYLIKTDSGGFSGCYEEPAPVVIVSPPTVESATNMQITSGVTVTDITNALTVAVLTQNDICFATAINEASSSQTTMTVYPNPFTSTATIELPGEYNHFNHAQVKVYDVCGRELKNFTVYQNEKIQLNAKDFNPGIYFANVIVTIDNENREVALTAKFAVE